MYKLHLILKYLRRRRIAWVSLAAVMLCTAMVIVVISIMGGWLRMYETSARGMTGDVVIKSVGLNGFAYYEEMITEIEKLPYVEAAVPQITTNGLVSLGFEGNRLPSKTEGVQVFGIKIDQIGKVNNWPQSLYLQHTHYLDRGEQPPAQKTFDPGRRSAFIKLGELPSGVAVRPDVDRYLATLERVCDWSRQHYWFIEETIGYRLWRPLAPVEGAAKEEAVWTRIGYDSRTTLLRLDGGMSEGDLAALRRASSSTEWRKAMLALGSIANRQGLIAGARVLEIHKDQTGKIIGRNPDLYERLYATLTVLGINETGKVDEKDKAERTYWVVDDSRTGMWQYDNKSVYVDFDSLQGDLNMKAKEIELVNSGRKITQPARVSEVNIKLKAGADVVVARDQIETIVGRVLDPHYRDRDTRQYARAPLVQTWRDASRTYLNAIETEKVLVVLLFTIISVVAVFLIFCIFYMIVAEKTKDIGIIKSVGATNGGVAGIFLGYGLAIGIVGAAMGLLLSYLIVHNINEIHDWLGRTFRLVVWNPEVYAFETIPSTMEVPTVTVILVVAVLASVLGALVPAIRAARMHPVEALRWE